MWQKDIETTPRSELETLQSLRLAAQVKRMYEKVPLFKNRMDEKGLKPSDIKGIGDLSKLPFSYKSDLKDSYPYGLFAEPLKNIARLHASSGTTSKRIVVCYTKNDLSNWADCTARTLAAAGIDSEDIVQVSYGYGLFTGGLGVHAGAEKLGAVVIPLSAGNTANQLQTMVDFGSTVLCCTPSYALYLAETACEMGILNKLRLRTGIFGAEPWSEEMRREIEKKLHIKAYDIYGLTEIMGPGVAYECECQRGMHVCEDMFIPEIISPDTLENLPAGETGELVFTTLVKEGFPLIRYRTKDICSLNYEKCDCGRTHVRLGKLMGRTDDMLIIRGVNVFPSQIEEALLNASGGTTPNYQIFVDRVNNTDTFDINVEMNEALFSDDIKTVEKTEKFIVSRLREILGVTANVHLVNPKSIERSEGKARRVIDKRKI